MKTTLEISDHLLARAKEVAPRRKTTLRSLTEEGLRYVVEADETKDRKAIVPVTMGGSGLSPKFQGASWTAIRDAAYHQR